jgi:VWFA-related protein
MTGQVGQVGRVGLVGKVRRVGAITLALACAVSGFSRTPVSAQEQPPPRFQLSVDVTTLDVNVVDDRGKPITDLGPDDFNVRIDGNRRKVTTAEWVSLTGKADAPGAPAPPDGYSTNDSASGGRLIVLAVDEPNIRFGGARAIVRAADAFIDHLSPSDRVAVAGFGPGAPATVFTSDHQRVKQAIARMTGRKQALRLAATTHNISSVEAQEIERGDRVTLEGVQNRECQPVGLSPSALEACRMEIESDARTLAQDSLHDTQTTIQSLRDLFLGLARIDAPKTLILISEGFVVPDDSMMMDLGVLAANARTSLYALRLDNQLFDIGDSRVPANPFLDRQARSEALEQLAASARGTLFAVAGTGQALFERIDSEISGYYLLGVESDPRDHDGKSHTIRVDVPRKGAVVRSRRQMLNTSADDRTARARSPRQAIAAALRSPLLVSALPLRVASFALQGPERGKVQILIHADVGADYAESKNVSVGYVISDANGRVVDNTSAEMRLLPTVSGVPSALQYTAGASLAPGDYTLKLAAAEGDRVGTVEHTIHAALPTAGGVTTSELMVGGPIDSSELLNPSIGYQVTFGAVHGYVEAYGSNIDALTMEYEVAASADAPALLNVDVPPRLIGDSRVIFTRVLPVQNLPPGRYILRAILSTNGRSVSTLTRAFEVAAPKVLMTSADGLGDTSVDGELYLPTDDATMSAPFVKELAVKADTLEAFRERLMPATRPAFDAGVASLTAGDYQKALDSFKRGIEPDVDSTASLAYLAATYAAAGHDREAASAWQTALVDGSDFPEIYEWLGGAQLRNHDLGEARAIYEEAAKKWPTDPRFSKPLAMLYGTFGRGREAVRTLERYIDARPLDRDAYFIAVQWIYTVHAGGAAVHTPADDRKLARAYADAYEKSAGPQLALVQQWIAFLDQER